jgi:glyoxylate carboligase
MTNTTNFQAATDLQRLTQLPSITAEAVVELFEAGHFSEDIPLLVDFEGHPVVDPDGDDPTLGSEYVEVFAARMAEGHADEVWLETEGHGLIVLDIDDEVPVDVPDEDFWVITDYVLRVDG